MWLEARRRGIEMRQLLFWGSPTDTFRVRVDGRIHIFKSLPLPPLHAETLRMDDKIWFKEALAREGLPVPKSSGASNLESAKRALAEFGTVCVKPRSGSNGRHTYPVVKTEEDLSAAFKSVKQICAFASVEEQLEGNLCRATCVGGKLLGFLESNYPTVAGDGVLTIRELVARANAEKPNGVADIVLDDSHTGYIRRRGYELDSVLPSGVSLPLTYRAGASSGGRNRERGRAVHPSFIPIIERAAALTGLSIVGFDLIIPDSEAPAESQRWGFIEANSLPWIDLHAAPFSGEPNDLSAAVWDLWLVS
jgi:cyanophycin synthetase